MLLLLLLLLLFKAMLFKAMFSDALVSPGRYLGLVGSCNNRAGGGAAIGEGTGTAVSMSELEDKEGHTREMARATARRGTTREEGSFGGIKGILGATYIAKKGKQRNDKKVSGCFSTHKNKRRVQPGYFFVCSKNSIKRNKNSFFLGSNSKLIHLGAPSF